MNLAGGQVRVKPEMKRSDAILPFLPTKILAGTHHFCTGK